MRIIKKMCKQNACYWERTGDDDYGNPVYAEVQQLKPPENGVRWEDVNEQITTLGGETIVSKSKVYSLQDLKLRSVLWLGEIKDLVSESKPFSNPGASEIQAINNIPTLSAKQKVRINWL